jgi:hypothetical protein
LNPDPPSSQDIFETLTSARLPEKLEKLAFNTISGWSVHWTSALKDEMFKRHEKNFRRVRELHPHLVYFGFGEIGYFSVNGGPFQEAKDIQNDIWMSFNRMVCSDSA